MTGKCKAKEQILLKLTGALFFANLNISSACAQTLDSVGISSDEPVWVYVIIGFVLATLACSAALPLAAIRQWSGAWKACAISPLIALAVWVGLIITAKQLDQSAHPLWMLELFSWSMLNLIFMVTAMTAKRTFEKSSAET
ncbi:hypothetical protein N9S63_02580 [OM182 bacterium]|nr:hypothetical protein [OM182 bacterium]